MKYFNKTTKTISGGIGALALGLSLSLGGCDKSEEISISSKPYEGIIWEKRHEPKREWIKGEYVGPKFNWERIPIYILDDEDFIFEVMRKDGDTFHNKTLYLDKETFNSFEIGDKFVYSGENAETKDPDFTRAPRKEEIEKCKNSFKLDHLECELK